MIIVLALVNGSTNPAVARWVAHLPAPLRHPLHRLIEHFAVSTPAALGKPLRSEDE